MSQNPVMTVRLEPDDLERLDRIARERGTTRSQLIQCAVRDVIAADRKRRREELDALRDSLRPAIEAQDEFRARASLSETWRRI